MRGLMRGIKIPVQDFALKPQREGGGGLMREGVYVRIYCSESLLEYSISVDCMPPGSMQGLIALCLQTYPWKYILSPNVEIT